MSKYPNISKFMPELRRTTIHGDARDFILMSDLEAVLAKGVVVYGQENSFKAHSKQNHTNLLDVKVPCDTHSGLLIGYQPIESSEPVTVDRIINVLKEISSGDKESYSYTVKDSLELIERIKRNGVGK